MATADGRELSEAEWAETVEINPDKSGVLRGAAAAAHGRALLRSVLEPGDPGRPV